MTYLYRTKFGSHVFGTNLPTSDTDIKGIFLPSPADILLQKAPCTLVKTTKLDKNAKNTAEDVDTELYSLHRYLELLMDGQTVAVDMLFTPKQFWISSCSHWWEYILLNKNKFLHSGTTSYVGYCRQQANKYGIKGSRVSAVRTILDYLKACPFLHQRLGDLVFLQTGKLPPSEHIAIVQMPNKLGHPERYLEVCNRKVNFTATVKYAIDVYQKIFDEYGARALQAEKNEGCDWKALSHAVRITREAIELLTTGNVTFPRPEASLLLKIRKGEMPYKEVAELIEQGMEELNAVKSILPPKPDYDFAKELVLEAYLERVQEL